MDFRGWVRRSGKVRRGMVGSATYMFVRSQTSKLAGQSGLVGSKEVRFQIVAAVRDDRRHP